MNPSLTPPPSYQVYPTAAPLTTATPDPYQNSVYHTGQYTAPSSNGSFGYQPEYTNPDPSHATLEIGGSAPQYYSQPGYHAEPLDANPSTEFFAPPRSLPLTGDHSVFFGKPPYEVTDDDRLWSLLCYVLSPIIPVVVFFLSRKRLRPFIRSHYAQAFVLGFINLILWSVLTWILSLLAIIPFVIWCSLVLLGVMAYQGNEINIPLLSPMLQAHGFA